MIHILIVHDCPLFRTGLRSFLQSQNGYRIVGEPTRLEEVLLLARAERVDVVLLDGGLTSADPREVVQQLRMVGISSILVFASQRADEEELFQFLKYGVMAYVSSSISAEELLATLRGMKCGEYFMTGEVLLAEYARRERVERIRHHALLAAKKALCMSFPPGDIASPLTEPEREVLVLFAGGYHSTAQIAETLGTSTSAIKKRVRRLYGKLDVRDRTRAVVVAMQRRWIELEPQVGDPRLWQRAS
jgi:two-component system NarL family response regulator